jgi:hypothetical protein
MTSSGSVPPAPRVPSFAAPRGSTSDSDAEHEVDVAFDSACPPPAATPKPVEFVLNPQVMMRRLSSTKMPAVRPADIAASLAASPRRDDESSR